MYTAHFVAGFDEVQVQVYKPMCRLIAPLRDLEVPSGPPYSLHAKVMGGDCCCWERHCLPFDVTHLCRLGDRELRPFADLVAWGLLWTQSWV